MCLIASKRMHPDNLPLIAKEDIEVYKGVKEVETYYNVISFDMWMKPSPYYIKTRKRYLTPYIDYPVDFKNGSCELSTMFHYNEILYGYEPCIKYQDPYEVFDGIHSIFANSPKLMDMRAITGVRIFDAIIPKGTKYYMGVEGDMVSERLIIYEQITIRDLMPMDEYFAKFVKRVD